MRNKWIMTFDLGHTIGNRKKRFLSYFYAGQLKTRKTIYGQSSLSTDRVRNRCLFCWTQKAFFYDPFCCRSLEFQKEISRKRSHKNCLKTSVQRKTDILTMCLNEQLRLSHENWGNVKSVMVSRCCHGYVDLENLSFFATQICTLQAGTGLFPNFVWSIFARRVQISESRCCHWKTGSIHLSLIRFISIS